MREFIDIIKKSLTESLTNVDIFGIDIPVIVSPSAAQIKTLLSKCRDIRGIGATAGATGGGGWAGARECAFTPICMVMFQGCG